MEDFLPRAILLDFYGTVVEEDDVQLKKICEEVCKASPLVITAEEIGSYWGRIFGQLCSQGSPTPKAYGSQSFGATFRLQKELERLSLQYVLHRFEADLDGDALSQMLCEYWAHPTIFPESREVLAKCKIPVCLVSNIDNAELQAALKYNNLCFDWVVTSEDCRAYKPRGEMFKKALSLFGLPAGKVLHVGDSLSSDVQGAKSQGIPVFWINRKKRPISFIDETPDYISTDLTGLLDIILEEKGAADIR